MLKTRIINSGRIIRLNKVVQNKKESEIAKGLNKKAKQEIDDEIKHLVIWGMLVVPPYLNFPIEEFAFLYGIRDVHHLLEYCKKNKLKIYDPEKKILSYYQKEQEVVALDETKEEEIATPKPEEPGQESNIGSQVDLEGPGEQKEPNQENNSSS